MNSTDQGKTYADFPRITHSGKYGVIFDAAYTSDGGLYYGSWTGSKQMCEGIAAALLDGGRRSRNSVYLVVPLNGEDGVWSRSVQVRIADATIGAIRRITKRVPGTRVWQVVLRSELIRWDYSYGHLQSRNAIEQKDDSDYAKAQSELAQRRFVLMADEEEKPEATAQRWFGYLPRRVSEPLLAEWAQPLWDYCVENDKGITEMQRLRGRAWLCEPSSDALWGAISYLGKRGELRLTENFPIVAEADAEADYGVVAVAAD
ncbi:MAG: hypothetical protein OXI16_02365 [Chloroflexota bacterium]|nr:hypothetical protein [Chloroflexota bacterium]